MTEFTLRMLAMIIGTAVPVLAVCFLVLSMTETLRYLRKGKTK